MHNNRRVYVITSAVGTHRTTLDLPPIKGHTLEPYRGAPMLEEPNNNVLSLAESGFLLLLLLFNTFIYIYRIVYS